MRIVFTGHRDRVTDEAHLLRLFIGYQGATWVHGGARDGFDAQVQQFIEQHEIPHEIHRPRYSRYHPRVAPLRRNDAMLDSGADLVVACWDGRTKGGTFYTVRGAKKRGIPVQVVRALVASFVAADTEREKGS